MPVSPDVHPEIAAAAVSPTEAVIQYNGESIIAPIDHIDPSMTELACNDDGCALIPDDGNPHNDVIVQSPDAHYYDHMNGGSINDGIVDPNMHGDMHFDDGHFHADGSYHTDHTHEEPMPLSSHGYALNVVGGNVQVSPDVHPEIAAAAVSQTEAVIQYNGESIIAPISHIDHTMTELACNDDGCALIPDDGNPYNDVVVAHPDHMQMSDPYMDLNHHFHDSLHLNDANTEQFSTHGIELLNVGGNIEVAPSVDPELAAAAISETEAIMQANGQSFTAPLDQIDPSKVELACNDDGCVLIPDDGNPENDIIMSGRTPIDTHTHSDGFTHAVAPEQHVFDILQTGSYSNVAPDSDFCPEIAHAAVDG